MLESYQQHLTRHPSVVEYHTSGTQTNTPGSYHYLLKSTDHTNQLVLENTGRFIDKEKNSVNTFYSVHFFIIIRLN